MPSANVAVQSGGRLAGQSLRSACARKRQSNSRGTQLIELKQGARTCWRRIWRPFLLWMRSPGRLPIAALVAQVELLMEPLQKLHLLDLVGSSALEQLQTPAVISASQM